VDPLAEKFPAWTPYHYVHNNPINLIDPTGMSAEQSGEGNPKKQPSLLKSTFEGISSTLDEIVISAKKSGFSSDKIASDWQKNKEKSGYNHFNNWFKDNWNTPLVRYMISDSYNISISSKATAFMGIGTTPLNFTLLTRGEEPGIYLTPGLHVDVGDGIEANVGISLGKGIYTGNPKSINSGMLEGNTFGVSVGVGAALDASIGASYAPTGDNKGFINLSGQFGIGIQGSPASVINVQGNYQYTPIVIPLLKF